jgi:hypothetical protein
MRIVRFDRSERFKTRIEKSPDLRQMGVKRAGDKLELKFGAAGAMVARPNLGLLTHRFHAGALLCRQPFCRPDA